MDPRLATAYSDRGVAYRKKGEYDKAIADYSEAMRLWPNWRGYYLNRGLAYAAAGRSREAIADFDVAIFLKPDFVEAFVARGDAYLQAGENGKALADYRHALRERGGLLKDYPGVAAKLAALGAAP